MSVSGSVSQWIESLKAGDHKAAARLWNRYYLHLMQLARRRLNGTPRRVVDEEDLVATAFQSFFQRAQDGQFPDLITRDELWAMLVTITGRKAVNNLRRHKSIKRGGGKVFGESALGAAIDGDGDSILSRIESGGPSPDAIAAITELFASLDDEMRRVVCLKNDGYTHEEIAQRVNRSVATVERRLQLLQHQWEQELLG